MGKNMKENLKMEKNGKGKKKLPNGQINI